MARLLEHRLVRLLLISAVAWILREVLITKPPGFGESDLLPSYVFPHMLVEHGPARVYLSMGFPYPEAAPADLVAMNRRFAGAAWYPTGFMYHPWTLFLLTPLAYALSLTAFERLFLAGPENYASPISAAAARRAAVWSARFSRRLRAQGGSGASPAMMQPCGWISPTTVARPKRVICAFTLVASL